MNTPEDPRIWQGIRTHLDELGSVAAVPPIRTVLNRPRSGRLPGTVAGLASAGALALVVGLVLPGLLPVSAPMTGVTPTSPSAQATADAEPTGASIDLSQLIGHTFVAIEVTENGQPVAIVPETRIGLRFIDGSHFAANGGCDDIGGDYEILDGRLKTANMRGFSRLCAGERGEQASLFLMFLQSNPAISRNTTGLVVSTGQVVITFVEESTT